MPIAQFFFLIVAFRTPDELRFASHFPASVHSCWSKEPHTNSAASGIVFLLQSQWSQQRDKGKADYLTTSTAGPSEEGRNTAMASLFHP